MAKNFYTEAEVRKAFETRCAGRTQGSIALSIGVKRQQVCAMLRGEAISKKAAAWVGFRPVNGLYERAK
jgi:hypothetical protein